MSVGNESAFPVVHETIRGGEKMVDAHLGMSYRQWLIGQIAGHVAAAHIIVANRLGLNEVPKEGVVISTITAVDAIIARLDETEKKA